MKIQYRTNRIEMLPENDEDEFFAKKIHRLISSVSNDLMSWWGDVSFDGKETSGYIVTTKLTQAELDGIV